MPPRHMSGILAIALPAAVLGGIAGGAHCAGMCGGIAGALCSSHVCGAAQPPRWRRLLAYNAGRITSYACAGALAGGLGQAGLLTRFGPVLQPLLFALASVLMVAIGLYVAGWLPKLSRIEAAGALLWRSLAPLTRHMLPVTTGSRAYMLGALWGWLPCGLVYAMLLTALATGSWWQGALVLAAFGLGTAPALLGIGMAWTRIERLRKASLTRNIAGAIVATFGLYGLLLAAHPHFAHEALLCQAPPAGAWLRGVP